MPSTDKTETLSSDASPFAMFPLGNEQNTRENKEYKNTPTATSNDTVIELKNKPISINRTMSIKMTPLGIPIIRDIIIIETEASLQRIITILLLLTVFFILLHCLIIILKKFANKKLELVQKWIIWGVPPMIAIVTGSWLFLTIWIVINLYLKAVLLKLASRSSDYDQENINLNEDLNEDLNNRNNSNNSNNSNNLNSNSQNNSNNVNAKERIPNKKTSFFKKMKNGVSFVINRIFHKITIKLSLFNNIRIENLYIQYSNIFYYSHIIVTITLFALLISMLFDSFILLNIGLMIFFYTNYFLILIQEIIIGSNNKLENQVINSEKDCGVCGGRHSDNGSKSGNFSSNSSLLKSSNQSFDSKLSEKQHFPPLEQKHNFLTRFKAWLRTNNSNNNSSKDVYTLPCSHKFHINCIRGYYLLTCLTSCPICHEKYTVENIMDSLLKGLFFFNIFMNIIRQAILYAVIGGIILVIVKLRNRDGVQHTSI